jgi:hypothetical protein
MRKIIVVNATIALRRSRRIFGSNTFAKRASNILDGHMGMGNLSTGGLFLQAFTES